VANSVEVTHDVTERLAWETQAPLTVRPDKFKPWPAKTDWKKEREQVEELLKSGKPAKVFKVKSSDGDTTKPDFEK